MGASQGYTYGTIQRSPIGSVIGAALKPIDILQHGRMRKAAGINPATIGQDFTYLRVAFKYAKLVYEMKLDMEVFVTARHLLEREQLISKGQARDRRLEPGEEPRLVEFFAEQDRHQRCVFPMSIVMPWQLDSCRRISETTGLLAGDVNHEKKTCLVRDLKNSKGKGFNDTFPLLGRSYEIIQARLEVVGRDPKVLLFPWNEKSVGKRFTDACARLGIDDLHLHDLRHEGISRLFEMGYSVPEVQRVSLHRNPAVLLKTYTNLRPEDLHRGPAARRALPEQRMAA